jgi:hypothetical protein
MLIALFGAIGRSRRTSLGSAYSAYSLLSVGSLLSIGSALSVGSAGSVLSIGSAGSILSIGSAGSILSIGSVGRVLSIGAGPDARRAAAMQQEVARDLSRMSARLRTGATRLSGSRLPRAVSEAVRAAGGSLAR